MIMLLLVLARLQLVVYQAIQLLLGYLPHLIESLTEYMDKHKEYFVHTFLLNSEEKRVLKNMLLMSEEIR